MTKRWADGDDAAGAAARADGRAATVEPAKHAMVVHSAALGEETVGSTPAEMLLTTVEAAREVRLSPRTLERLRVTGEGPRYVKAGPGKRAKVLYRSSDLKAWLDRFSYGSTSEYAGGGSQG